MESTVGSVLIISKGERLNHAMNIKGMKQP